MSDVDEQVRILIADIAGMHLERVERDQSLNSLGFDSLDQVELVMYAEECFDLSIPDEETAELLTVGDVISYISERLGES